jgi:hypothetical protein
LTPWEQFINTLSYEKLMGATPLVLLEWFYTWLKENKSIRIPDEPKREGCTCNAYRLENFGCKCGA